MYERSKAPSKIVNIFSLQTKPFECEGGGEIVVLIVFF